MKHFGKYLMVLLFVSCTSSGKLVTNLSYDEITMLYHNKITNENVNIKLDIDEIKLIIYEDSWSFPKLQIKLDRKSLYNFDSIELNDIFNDILSIHINNTLISERISLISNIIYSTNSENKILLEFLIDFRIDDEVVNFIRNLKYINVIEEFRENIYGIYRFDNTGNINNVFNLGNNYISTLYSFLNTSMSEIIIFLDEYNLEYEYFVDNRPDIFYLEFSLTHDTYISLFYNKIFFEGKRPIYISLIQKNNIFKDILPKVLREIGEPNGAMNDLPNNFASWSFTNASVLLQVVDNFTSLMVTQKID